MKSNSLKQIAEKMRQLGFCMMTTVDGRGTQFSRLMSNNGEVEYDGNSWFFTYEQSDKVSKANLDQPISKSWFSNAGYALYPSLWFCKNCKTKEYSCSTLAGRFKDVVSWGH